MAAILSKDGLKLAKAVFVQQKSFFRKLAKAVFMQ